MRPLLLLLHRTCLFLSVCLWGVVLLCCSTAIAPLCLSFYLSSCIYLYPTSLLLHLSACICAVYLCFTLPVCPSPLLLSVYLSISSFPLCTLSCSLLLFACLHMLLLYYLVYLHSSLCPTCVCLSFSVCTLSLSVSVSACVLHIFCLYFFLSVFLAYLSVCAFSLSLNTLFICSFYILFMLLLYYLLTL